ncbi:MAG: biopolymer transporter ExbD [Bacteroidia bacterium]
MAKAKRTIPEINAASMADIAFLLLIFFLLVTTIDTDKGIARKLPPIPLEPPPPLEEHDRNVLIILVNSADQMLVDGELLQVDVLRETTKEFVMNPYNKPTLAESPQDAIVSLKNDRGTSYDIYIQIQNELTAAYNELRDEAALRRFGTNFNDLNRQQQSEIKEIIPMKISEAEPENIGEQ